MLAGLLPVDSPDMLCTIAFVCKMVPPPLPSVKDLNHATSRTPKSKIDWARIPKARAAHAFSLQRIKPLHSFLFMYTGKCQASTALAWRSNIVHTLFSVVEAKEPRI